MASNGKADRGGGKLRLTDNEIRDITQHLEAGIPLPDKYRFLLFDEKREVELVWNGKSNEVCNVVLPFQTIEHVDEPRAEKPEDKPLMGDLFATDSRGRQLQGWTNKLIWGDNKLILSSLKNGPMREAIEAHGGLKLIYIDPPFDVGADFSMDIAIGDESFTKKPNILEEIAYRDTWGRGADSFIAMIYERLVLMRDLLAADGSIYVHCDWRVNSSVRAVLDEVLGTSNFVNDITWKRASTVKGNTGQGGKFFDANTDTIYLYRKSESNVFNPRYGPYSPEYIKSFYKHTERETGRRYQLISMTAPGDAAKGNPRYDVMGVTRYWRYSEERMAELIDEGLVVQTKEGNVPRKKLYLDEGEGVPVQTLWDDVAGLSSQSSERVGYPTQKPAALLNRIVRTSSNEGDLVADFFAGSGTTAAVAEKLGRKWICSDIGKFAIHTTRKRMIGVQRQMKADGEDYRAFEILNLGRYERQHFVGVNPNLREEERRRQLEEKEAAFLDLILRAYQAEKTEGFASFHGKRAGRLVAVGPVNLPVTRLFVEEIILECRKNHITRVDILGFEFEMGLFPHVLEEARGKGIDIAPKYIPAEVFDRRAVERNQVVFHDVAYIEVKPHVFYPPDKGGKGGYLSYNPQLTEKARENRKNPTPAETRLWFEILQGKRLGDLKFTRQKPLDEYIVDFYCAELLLAIEIDGDSHANQVGYDKYRTERLNAIGVEVVRYTNAEVLENLEGIYHDLIERIAKRQPPESPLSGGLPSVAVELTDFSVAYSQDSIAGAEASLKKKGSKIVVEKGQIVKVSRDKDGIITRETLTQHWTDWIDYWSVDFDFESRRETVQVQNPETGETEERWTGDYIFENEWQSFRTRKDRSLELSSVAHECPPGRRKIAVKVVDIFGNDTMTIIEVRV